MLTELFDSTRRRITAALSAPELIATAAAIEGAGLDRVRGQQLIAAVVEDEESRTPIAALRDASDLARDGSLERLLLLRAALASLPRVDALPVSDDVKRLFCETYDYIATPPRGAVFDAGRGSFVSLAKIATLRRFPAGQFHWEVSGIPRSWLFKVKGREQLALMYMVALRLRGLAPVFFIHLNAHRKNRFLLTERDANRAYYRMAQSMALQPGIKAFVASSWLNSPDTFAVSPHLTWMNRTFVEHGALEVRMGAADPDCGVLARSPERKKAFDDGTFKPTVGLVVWPRREMLAWAAAHPELGARSSPPVRHEDPADAVAASHAG